MHPSQRPVFVLDKPRPLWQYQGIAVVVALLLLGTCVQLYHWLGSDPQAPYIYKSADTQFLGRNYKMRILEQQLAEKESEVLFLQHQISRAALNIKLKEGNLEAADAMIKSLQDREHVDRTARTKAQYALAEKVSELNSCITRRMALESELATCGADLLTLTRKAQVAASDNVHEHATVAVDVPELRHKLTVGAANHASSLAAALAAVTGEHEGTLGQQPGLAAGTEAEKLAEAIDRHLELAPAVGPVLFDEDHDAGMQALDGAQAPAPGDPLLQPHQHNMEQYYHAQAAADAADAEEAALHSKGSSSGLGLGASSNSRYLAGAPGGGQEAGAGEGQPGSEPRSAFIPHQSPKRRLRAAGAPTRGL